MMKLKTFFSFLSKIFYSMIGVNDYASYVEHCQTHHPGKVFMSYKEFFQTRQQARYSNDKQTCC